MERKHGFIIAMCFTLLSTAGVPAADGLIAAYNFEEGSGDTVLDQSDNGNHGRICGAVRTADGFSGSALSFDGVDDSVLVCDLGIEGNLPRTLALWFNAAVDENSQHLWASVISVGGDHSQGRAFCIDVRNEDGSCSEYAYRRITGHYYQSSTCSDTTLSQIGINQWHHIALTHDGGGQALYLNGRMIGQSSLTELNTLAGTTKIGARPGLDGYFNGRIDEVKVYNRGLSVAEIQALYESYLGPVPVLISVQSPTLERRPRLSWYAMDDTASYVVQIDTTSDFTAPLVRIGVEDTVFTLLGNLPMQEIYWRVGAGSPLLFSRPDSFVIQPDTIPFLNAFNGREISQQKPLFSWRPVGRAAGYRIQVDTLSGFLAPLIQIDVEDTSFIPLSNLAFRTYFWRVSCDLNLSAFSPLDSLKIVPDVDAVHGPFPMPGNTFAVSPNPFKTAAVIRFSGIEGKASIVITDMNGSVVGRWDNLKGCKLEWNAARQPSGIYLVRLVAGARVSTRCVCLIR